ncbi:class I SAM-dependent rRNA methyltransferase [Granulosicoccaceae sp. 1_MG-2023]|nr:class I SAM-dependent rRNA methyltransferase [Granulosicoccaceae sp. 1_MG-2023]
MDTLRLRKGEERRLLAGHLWVFSNEVDVKATPLTGFEPGQPVLIASSRGEPIGHGYVNPHSLIAARLCSRGTARPLDAALIRARLEAALALREAFYDKPFYRLVHSEGDWLPGVVIDRYGDVLVMQVNTAGMERMLDVLLAELDALIAPATVLLRNDSPVRELENLPRYVKLIKGSLPEQVTVEENGLRFLASLDSGQKTGWFYDHRENRAALRPLSQGKRVLDVFSYLGGWGLNAAAGGAAEVLAVDASAAALALAAKNAELNGFGERFSTRCGDAADVLRALADEGAQFDIVVLDPPAFIKRRKDHKAGLAQYELINRLGMALLADGGLLVSASCSQHLSAADLNNAMIRAARKNRASVQVLSSAGQGPDHPVNAAMPETAYLKSVLARLIR